LKKYTLNPGDISVIDRVILSGMQIDIGRQATLSFQERNGVDLALFLTESRSKDFLLGRSFYTINSL
jgi:hypothetical protein